MYRYLLNLILFNNNLIIAHKNISTEMSVYTLYPFENGWMFLL